MKSTPAKSGVRAVPVPLLVGRRVGGLIYAFGTLPLTPDPTPFRFTMEATSFSTMTSSLELPLVAYFTMLLHCYVQPGEQAMRTALEHRKTVRAAS